MIDEYVELAKAFFDATEAGFINAALDAIAGDRAPGPPTEPECRGPSEFDDIAAAVPAPRASAPRRRWAC